MTCYNPMIALDTHELTENGKPKYKIYPWSWYKAILKSGISLSSDYIQIPCGSCLGCRSDKANDWSTRVLLEALNYNFNYFITLTYDELHKPSMGSISKEHLRAFIKSVRNYWKKNFDLDGIRYFGCGEYGEHGLRPHYHVIMFNFPIFDLVLLPEDSKKGYVQYTSYVLNKLWSKGRVVISKFQHAEGRYVAQYTTKKLRNEKISDDPFASESTKWFNPYKKLGLIPPFLSMSTHPGLGYKWFTEHPEIYQTDSIVVATEDGGVNLAIPKYFDRKTVETNPDLIDSIKKKRKTNSEISTIINEKERGISHLQMLENNERFMKEKIRRSQR